MKLPKNNVEWTSVPPGVAVKSVRVGESRNSVYIASLPSGDALVNWSSCDAVRAQRCLDLRVQEGVSNG